MPAIFPYSLAFFAISLIFEKTGEKFYLKDVEGVEYLESKYEVLKNSEALILLTEWKEFRSPDFEKVKMQLNNLEFQPALYLCLKLYSDQLKA